jgi:hypothetical protein
VSLRLPTKLVKATLTVSAMDGPKAAMTVAVPGLLAAVRIAAAKPWSSVNAERQIEPCVVEKSIRFPETGAPSAVDNLALIAVVERPSANSRSSPEVSSSVTPRSNRVQLPAMPSHSAMTLVLMFPPVAGAVKRAEAVPSPKVSADAGDTLPVESTLKSTVKPSPTGLPFRSVTMPSRSDSSRPLPSRVSAAVATRT